jgi:dimethylargininase
VLLALTRAVPPSIASCELTHLERAPIDPARAAAQHARYEKALESLGCTILRLPPQPDLPDSVFVEDAAVVLPGLAIIARPGADSRRGEVQSVAEALAAFRSIAFIEPPGTLDGGDVLRIGTRILVGLSERTSEEGVRQLSALATPLGYRVEAVAVSGCLHLKTAVTQVAAGAVLLNPAWIDPALFPDMQCIEVAPEEPHAANVLLIGDAVLFPAAYERTRQRLEEFGVRVHAVEADELAKAEGGLTCCSILVEA